MAAVSEAAAVAAAVVAPDAVEVRADAAEAAAPERAVVGRFTRPCSVTAIFRSEHKFLDKVPKKNFPSVVVSASSWWFGYELGEAVTTRERDAEGE